MFQLRGFALLTDGPHIARRHGCVDRDNDRDGVLDAYEFKDGRWTNCDRKVQGGVEVDCRNQPEDHDGDGDDDG